jgi:glycine/D-amino acid oxidase-like deaminating enzyme
LAARCVVVGAGIVGSCIALHLAQQGADVTVVEANRPG